MARRSFVLVVVLLLGCGGGGGGGGPTAPSCVNIAGNYQALFANSCGQQGQGFVVVAQSDCNFSAALLGEADVRGSLNGRDLSFSVAWTRCGGGANGTGRVEGDGTINGTFSGSATGPGCCGPVTGSFTLTR